MAQTSVSPEARRTYAELAKTWLTIAGDLVERESQLQAEPEKKKGGLFKRKKKTDAEPTGESTPAEVKPDKKSKRDKKKQAEEVPPTEEKKKEEEDGF